MTTLNLLKPRHRKALRTALMMESYKCTRCRSKDWVISHLRLQCLVCGAQPEIEALPPAVVARALKVRRK